MEGKHLQESAWKRDDKFVGGSLDKTILDIDPVCHELILGSDNLFVRQPELDETQSETSPPLKDVLAVLERGFSVEYYGIACRSLQCSAHQSHDTESVQTLEY